MKKILLYTLMTVAAAGMTACEDFLTRDTYDQIGSDEFWKSETDLELYANGFLQKMIPGDGTITRGDIDADYCAVDIATDLLRPDGNVSPDNQGGWTESSWTNLRRVNYMLDNMHRCRGRVSDEVYNHYEGVARFWRAWFYYDKVRTFGAVPWYDFTISASDKEALTKPRDSREYVMDAVHQRRAADAGGDLRPRIQQGTFGLPRNQLVLLFADLRYQDRHDQEVHEHLPHDQGHALHRHRRL